MLRFLFLPYFLFTCLGAAAQDFRIARLHCEHRVNPVGIDMAKPSFGWQIDAASRGFIQSAYQIQVGTDSLQLIKNIAGEWSTGKILSSQSQLILYAGKKLQPAKKYFWRARTWDQGGRVSSWSVINSFITGLPDARDWWGAKWIGYEDLHDTNRVVPGVHLTDVKKMGDKLKQRSIVPLFRKEFSVKKKLTSALVFVSGLGHYEMYCNGEKTGNSFLAPGWTWYDKRWLYNVYDITHQLKQGSNALGVIVGNGFYNINRERYFKLVLAFGLPKMICRLHLQYEDGTTEEIVSDESWKTTPSPITYSSIFGGEDYDAQAEHPGWAAAAFNDSQWKNAIAVKPPKGKGESEKAYPVTINDEFKVRSIDQPAPGIYLYDFGQNASGIVRLKVKGKKGQTVKLSPAELINDKSLANQNATGKPYYFSYTLKGDGEETWSPRFTYYGFRYVQVEGAVPDTSCVATDLPRISLTSLHTSSSAPETGSFLCDNELFNRINQLIRWGIRSNMQSVITDCPHREKLSWLEQDHLMGSSIQYNFDMYHLYKKLVYDMMDAQTAEGLVPDIAPEFVFFDDKGFGFRDSPEWGSAAVVVPWLIYKWYGDKEILRVAYPMMKKYVAWLQSRADKHILSYGLGDWYDLGPKHPGVSQLTPNGLTATAIYYYDITMLQKMATLLNDPTESAKLAALGIQVKKAFNDKFFDKNKKVYATGSQTSMAMPLMLGLVDEKNRDAVFKNFVDSINVSGKSLTAGDIGFHYVVQALDVGGASQLLYDMNFRNDVPGYGFQLKKGATALTESWAALGGVSNNHLMLGHIMEWFYTGLAGIDQAANSVGFKEIEIKPEIVGDINYVKANYETFYGTVSSLWYKEGNNFSLDVQVPANTTALVYLPAKKGVAISEGKKGINGSKDIKLLRFEKDRAVIRVGSGRYQFEVKVYDEAALINIGYKSGAAFKQPVVDLEAQFKNPPASAKPWVFWYWMQAAVSKEGITADLEAMKEAGIGGAYLMPIKGATNPPLYTPVVEQLSPLWWQMVKHAMQEADRLNLKIAMHVSDGFALAGGPWITPELSMQKLVWTKTFVSGKKRFNDTLAKPPANENYYKDIAVYAIPYPKAFTVSTNTVKPKITTSTGAKAAFLIEKDSKESFRCDSPCFIQYEFDRPFTARSLVTRTNGNNFQSHRFTIAVSDDGTNFRTVTQLEPPRHGWQDTDEDVTHSIPATTARFFRFVYNKSGTEPGAEDLDAAKWRQSLKVAGIELSAEPVINQYEGKNGSVWRVSKRTTQQQLPDSVCIPLNKIINITSHMTTGGRLNWNVPAGDWMILRMGHTSTGHTNATGGGGKGLECDKFDPKAVRLQFDKWFGEAIRQVGPELAKRVLQILHVDSWECGSQNWSPVFRNEFKRVQNADLVGSLPAMAGVPILSAEYSEDYLHDVRETIVQAVNDNFYGTLAALAKEKGVQFSAESIAPTMTSDGLLHYKNVDIPMGEFWVNSPTHDKPNDMLDAISGAHIYGKQIIQAEAFTTLRMDWGEHPGNLKALGDRNYALGINRMVYHVFMHNPWTDRQPGMTLDGVGLYFQRNQTWWKPGKAWVEYAQRCQALLQLGKPVVDVAVFTGAEVPRRSILPGRLVNFLPGIFGDSIVQREKRRLANVGEPLRELPDGVTHSANIADPLDWIDPLHGYAYDCINPDALQLSKSKDGFLELPGGAKYSVFINPAVTKPITDFTFALEMALQKKPKIYIREPFLQTSFRPLGLEKDFEAFDANKQPAKGIAWTHRRDSTFDIYFISNQLGQEQTLQIYFRVAGKAPEIWDPVTGEIITSISFSNNEHRTQLPVQLPPFGSLFIVFRNQAPAPAARPAGKNRITTTSIDTLDNAWTVNFDPHFGGPSKTVQFDKLQDWTTNADSAIKYYSGTASYSQQFFFKKPANNKRIWLDVGEVANIATVYVNGVNCGVAWTAPYRVDITNALREGSNDVKIEVTNTWANRLIGDQFLPAEKRITWTTAPFRLKGKPLLKAGLLGPVTLNIEKSNEH
jgi:hypothetical protein